MLRTVLLGVIVVLFTAAAITLASKLPKQAAAAHHVSAPVDPAILHSALQRGRDDMALP